MVNGDHIVADLHFLDEELDNSLPFGDVQRVGGHAQPVQEPGQGLGQPQLGVPVLDTIHG